MAYSNYGITGDDPASEAMSTYLGLTQWFEDEKERKRALALKQIQDSLAMETATQGLAKLKDANTPQAKMEQALEYIRDKAPSYDEDGNPKWNDAEYEAAKSIPGVDPAALEAEVNKRAPEWYDSKWPGWKDAFDTRKVKTAETEANTKEALARAKRAEEETRLMPEEMRVRGQQAAAQDRFSRAAESRAGTYRQATSLSGIKAMVDLSGDSRKWDEVVGQMLAQGAIDPETASVMRQQGAAEQLARFSAMDEPPADPKLLPMWQLAKLVAEQVDAATRGAANAPPVTPKPKPPAGEPSPKAPVGAKPTAAQKYYKAVDANGMIHITQDSAEYATWLRNNKWKPI